MPKYCNIVEPFSGVFIVGGPKSGKSYSFINPIIDQSVAKHYSGIVYDNKFPALTNRVYSAYQASPKNPVRLIVANFDDMTRTARLNPFNPVNIKDENYCEEYVATLYKNLDKSFIDSSGNSAFFTNSAVAIYTAITWFFKKKYPKYCTIPHTVFFATDPRIKKIFHKYFATDPEIQPIISSVLTAIEEDKQGGQISAVFSSMQNPLRKLTSEKLCWVLNPDPSLDGDISLELNNWNSPTLLSIGNPVSLKESINPVIALITAISVKLMNREPNVFENEQLWHSTINIDECAQIIIPGLEDVPATGRSRKIATVLSTQSMSQLNRNYGKENAQVLFDSLNTKIFGLINNPEERKMVMEMMGQEDKVKQQQSHSVSTGSRHSVSDSESTSTNMQHVITTRMLSKFKTGEFVGSIFNSVTGEFHGKMLPDNSYKQFQLPAFAKHDDIDANLTNNKIRIKHQVNELIEDLLQEKERIEVSKINQQYS